MSGSAWRHGGEASDHSDVKVIVMAASKWRPVATDVRLRDDLG